MPRSEQTRRSAGLSLTARLATAITLILALGGLGVAGAALTYGRDAAEKSFDRLLIGAANQIAASVTLRDGQVVVDLPVSAFELLSLAPEDRIVYAVYDRNGQLVTGYQSLSPQNAPDALSSMEIGGELFRIASTQRVFAERAYSGRVDVLVGQTTRARESLSAEITRNALVVVAITGALMSAFAFFAVRSALNPLQRIERDIARRAPNDLTPIDVAVPREIESLVGALNGFMIRLDRQVTILRNLIADASHQLRTPIAALRAQAELAEEETEPDRLRHILERVRTRSVMLGRLTDQLLNHALVIHRADSVALERLDLRSVAIQAIEETDHVLFGEQTRPQLDLSEDPVMCDGDPLSLVEAAKNLLGNALRHGEEPVSLAVTADPDFACLAVRDSGDGIPEDHWPDAGTRYARDTGVSPESAGLGLAIARAVAIAHRGELRFSHVEPHGFETAIVLPLRGGAAP